MTSFDIDRLRLDIRNLLLQYPVLAEDEVLREDMFEAETDLRDTLRLLARKKREADELVDALIALVSHYKERKVRLEARIEALRQLMLELLQAADLKRIELPEATLSQVNRAPQIVGEIDVDALPDDLVRIKREPDRVAIRDALLAHREVPGLSLSNAPPGLMMR